MNKDMSNKKKRIHKMMIAGIIELVILSILLYGYIDNKWLKEPDSLDTGIKTSDFESDYTDFSNGWHFKAESIETEVPINALYGPFVNLPKGDYTLLIGYDCDFKQKVELYSAGEESKYIEANSIELDPYLKALSYDFRLKEPLEAFEVRAYYDGNGDFSLNEISVYKNLSGYKRWAVILLICSVIIDICIWKWKNILEHKESIICIISIAAFSCLPLMAEGMGYGEDLGFHLLRIEGLASEIRLGHIPVRMQAIWMHGNGHPVSIFYGDILLYFPALLRIAGFTVNASYFFYVVFINSITVIISYFSFKYIITEEKTALIMTGAYALSTCRLVMMYWGSNVGSYTAQAFFPMIAAALYCIYAREQKKSGPDIKASLTLALAMSGVILSHVLSVQIIIFAMLLFAIIDFRKTLTGRTISTVGLAALTTMLLTLFFDVPFLDYYLNVDVSVTHNIKELPTDIQDMGLDILQLFSFFETHDDHNHIPGLLLMVTLVSAILIIIKGKADRVVKILTVYSIIIVLISTNLFPWDWLSYNVRLFNYMSVIQFPSRYIPVACLSLTILLGIIIKRDLLNISNPKMIYTASIVLLLISPLAFFGQYLDQIPRVRLFDSADVDTAKYQSTEYLRVNEDGEPIIKPQAEVIAEGGVELLEVSQRGWTINMHIRTSDRAGFVRLPLDNFRYYKCIDSAGSAFEIIDDEYCKASFFLPEGYDGYLTVSFVEPWFWRLSEITSLVAWITLVILLFIRSNVKSVNGRNCSEEQRII